MTDWSSITKSIPAAGLSTARGGTPIVPRATVAGQGLIAVLAIMSLLACAAAGAVSMVTGSVAAWQSEVGREITIQIKPAPNVSMELLLARAVAIAEEYPGIERATPLTVDQNVALLEPWLGAGIDPGQLPLPRLVLVELENASALNIINLRTAIENAVPGASVDDHRVWSDQLRRMSTSVTIAGFSVLLLVLGAATLTVIFATRSAMAENRATIDVLHFVGAADSFIAAEFQRHFLLQGAKGAGIGGLLAALLLTFFSWLILPPDGSAGLLLSGRYQLGLSGILWIAAVIMVIAIVTAATSRLTVYHALAEYD